jgi:hypothetical protein
MSLLKGGKGKEREVIVEQGRPSERGRNVGAEGAGVPVRKTSGSSSTSWEEGFSAMEGVENNRGSVGSSRHPPSSRSHGFDPAISHPTRPTTIPPSRRSSSSSSSPSTSSKTILSSSISLPPPSPRKPPPMIIGQASPPVFSSRTNLNDHQQRHQPSFHSASQQHTSATRIPSPLKHSSSSNTPNTITTSTSSNRNPLGKTVSLPSHHQFRTSCISSEASCATSASTSSLEPNSNNPNASRPTVSPSSNNSITFSTSRPNPPYVQQRAHPKRFNAPTLLKRPSPSNLNHSPPPPPAPPSVTTARPPMPREVQRERDAAPSSDGAAPPDSDNSFDSFDGMLMALGESGELDYLP